MELAVIFRDEKHPEAMEEYTILLPAVMLSEKVIYTSDYAQYFEMKEILPTLNFDNKLFFLRKAIRRLKDFKNENGLDELAKRHKKLRGMKTIDKRLSAMRMEMDRMVYGFEKSYLKIVESNLMELRMDGIEELNRQSHPHFIELYKTLDAISPNIANKSLIDSISRVLLNSDVIPVFFNFVREADFCRPFNSISDFSENYLYCSDEPIFTLPALNELTTPQLEILRQELLLKSSDLRCGIEQISAVLRNFKPGEEYEAVVEKAFDSIEGIYEEFNEVIYNNYFVQFLKQNNKIDEVYNIYLGVCPVIKLLKLYSIHRTINSSLELYLAERYLKQINPDARILILLSQRNDD